MAEAWRAPAWDEWPCTLVLTEEEWSTDGECALDVRRKAIPFPNAREADRYATESLGMLRQPLETFRGAPTSWTLHGRHASLRFEPPEWIDAETDRLARWLREQGDAGVEVRREAPDG